MSRSPSPDSEKSKLKQLIIIVMGFATHEYVEEGVCMDLPPPAASGPRIACAKDDPCARLTVAWSLCMMCWALGQTFALYVGLQSSQATILAKQASANPELNHVHVLKLRMVVPEK